MTDDFFFRPCVVVSDSPSCARYRIVLRQSGILQTCEDISKTLHSKTSHKQNNIGSSKYTLEILLRNLLVLSQVHKTKYLLYFVLIVNANVMFYLIFKFLKLGKRVDLQLHIVLPSLHLNSILYLLGFHIVLK